MKNLSAKTEDKPPKEGKTNYLICKFLGHDFDPVNVFWGKEEYCSRCRKKCDENDRWFDWKSWLRWRFISITKIYHRCKGEIDKYSF